MPLPRRPLLLLLALALLATSLAAGCRPLDRRFVTDEAGRALILHGANVSASAKSHPLRMPWVERDDVARLARDWGFNFARFLIFWDALEPAPGMIDAAYLDRVQEKLDFFAEAGILVVLDMHQDVYSQVFCCDGAPAWAVRDDGLPFTPQAVWFQNYAQPAVRRAFDNFFATEGPHTDLQDHYAAAWAAVAARFRDHPAVLGYDLMNEPSPGTTPSGTFEATLLTTFNQRMIDAIRAVDPDGWIFFEPIFALPAAGWPSFLGPLTDPRAGEPRLAYFPHLYSFAVEGRGFYDPGTDPTIPSWKLERRREGRAWSVPMLIGEFGAVDGTGGTETYLNEILRMADHVTSGWAVWEYNDDGWGFLNSDGTEKPKLAPLVRAYPQRVAGTPTWIDFDPASRILALSFVTSSAGGGETEIYVPETRLYPGGFDLHVGAPAGSWTSAWDPDREVLTLTTDGARGVGLCIAPSGVACP